MAEKITKSRNVLVPGHPDRDWIQVWSVDFDLFTHQFPVGQLVDTNNNVVELKQFYPRPWLFTEPFHSCFRILNPISAGTYQLLVDGVDAGSVEVRDVFEPQAFTTATSMAQLKTKLAAGRDTTLAPGTYILKSPLSMPDNTRLIGYGARIIVEPKAKLYGGFDDIIFSSIGDRCEIRGIEFVFPNGFYPPDVTELVVADCKFKSNNWRIEGQNGTSAGGWLVIQGVNNIVQNCVFSYGGRGGGDGAAWVGCRFYGLPDANCHAFQCDGNKEPLMMLDCLFDGTDRGPMIRPLNRDVNEVFVSHIQCQNMNQMYNGCEALGFEGSFQAQRSIWNNFRISNCASVLQLGSKTFKNRFHGFHGDDVYVNFTDEVEHTENYFYNSELRYGRIYLGNQATNNRVFYVGIIGWRLSVHNQFNGEPGIYAAKDANRAAITQVVPSGNNIENNTYRLPSDVQEVLELTS